MVQNQRDEADLEEAEEKAGITRESKEIKEKKEKDKLNNNKSDLELISGNGTSSALASSTASSSGSGKMDVEGGVGGVSTGPGSTGADTSAANRIGTKTETMTKGSKDYYENTHKRNERVSQPQMLR